MTDKELLELAAKAAGYSFSEEESKSGRYWVGHGQMSLTWNPLTDDGDALRLAVKLGMNVDVDTDSDNETLVTCGFTYSEPHNNDPYAATRRAIVRAAAEIAKGM
jgi:hypothetical protein